MSDHNGRRRVRVFEKGGDGAKLVVVPDTATLSELLLLCGRKLGLRATQLFLDDRCEVEAIEEVQDGDALFVVGVKDEFPGGEDVLSLVEGSYTAAVLGGTSLAEVDFRRTVAGGLGSMARRMDQLSTQVGALDKKLQQLIDVMSQNGLVLAQQQQQHFEHQEKKEAAAAAAAAAAAVSPAPAPAAGGAGEAGEELVRRKAAESVKTWRVAQTLEGHTGPVWCLVAVEVRNILISGSSDTTIKIWDIFTFKCRHTLKGHLGIVHSLLVTGILCYSASDDKSIRIWDLNTIQCKKILQDHEDCVVALAVSTDQKYLFSGSYHQIRVWDIQNEHKCVKILIGHNHWVRALHTAEGYLFSGCHNLIKIWDAAKLELVRTIPTNGVGKSIYSISVVGSSLLAGCFENMIQVWDLKSFEMTTKLTAHRGAVYCISVMGVSLFSGSYDNTIRVWDLKTMECVQVLKGHTSKVEAICAQLVQAQTPMLFSASSDHSIKVWTLARLITF